MNDDDEIDDQEVQEPHVAPSPITPAIAISIIEEAMYFVGKYNRLGLVNDFHERTTNNLIDLQALLDHVRSQS